MKRTLNLVLIMCTVLWIGGCGVFVNKQEKLFNNENRLLESGDSFTFENKVGEISSKEADFKFSGFSGVFTVWKINSQNNETITIKIEGSINRGKFKLIQTTEDHQLSTIWIGDKEGNITLEIPKGKSALKWVGKKAAGKIKLQFDPPQGLVADPQTDLFEGGFFEDE
ncbi:hypothetical protein [Paenibacillus tianjinensis]|uniref:Lipoprotein n=1 Tax=Paenibacillus tianjinensis TaxID=2810347 RepID=A0ABX7LCN0_9BACL|nr:hypothetical protein [Paenibacillus tianjinensis]QSF44230.1 hypothetical protein JRJ22_23915 [Paenibacillus tianjinensis]